MVATGRGAVVFGGETARAAPLRALFEADETGSALLVEAARCGMGLDGRRPA